jgi:peptidoglycan biosynthesis protein MviN/MurJ (putative lipid II flippase)
MASRRVAALLAILALAIPGWIVQQVAIRAFFAREEMWRAMGLGTAVALGVIPAYLVLGDRHGAEGVAAAGVLAISINALLTLAWARVRFGGPALLPLADTMVRSSVVGVAAAWAGRFGAGAAAMRGGPWFQLVIGSMVFLLVAGPGIRFVGDATMRETLSSLAERLAGSWGGRKGAE